MRTIYSILPELKNSIGHTFEYALSLKKSAEMFGWRHIAWAPTDCEFDPFPDFLEKNLIPDIRLSTMFNHFFAYRKALRTLSDPNSVLFLEQFRFLHLFVLFLALLFSQKPSELWLLFRYAPNQLTLKGKPQAYLVKALKWLLGGKNVRLLTDSTLLQKQQEKLFQCSITLLPIPHGKMTTVETFPKIEGVIDCWWPGGSTREDKGLRHIRLFSQRIKQENLPIRLIAAKNTAQKGVQATLYVENNMSRSNYEKWFNTVDIVLLPYDPQVYHSATSGIFVETILAGAIPVVRDGTWMASELKRYGLDPLIFDWEDPALPSRLVSLKKNKKLEDMAEEYRKFHSIEGFAESMFRDF